MSRKPLVLVLASAGMLAVAQGTLTLFVNGKPSSKAPIEQAGELYIPASALKEAGAVIERKEDRITVRFVPVPGAVQLDAIDGQVDEWVQNGIWRIRVSNPRNESGIFKLDFEIRNATKATLSPAVNTGIAIPQLFSPEGGIIDTLPRSDAAWAELVSPNLPPAAGGVRTLEWFPRAGTKPDKLVVRFEMNATRESILKKLKVAFDAANPHFRIALPSSQG